VLNSARANQSFGGLHEVWRRSFAALRLKGRRIERVLLLGLGAGSVVHILRKELGINAPIVAVDDDPEMVRIAREHFSLDHHAAVEVVIDDAFAALQHITGPFDLIVVDLFTEMDVPQALVEPAVIDRLGALRSPQGC
jgi:spermidine synthase